MLSIFIQAYAGNSTGPFIKMAEMNNAKNKDIGENDAN